MSQQKHRHTLFSYVLVAAKNMSLCNTLFSYVLLAATLFYCFIFFLMFWSWGKLNCVTKVQISQGSQHHWVPCCKNINNRKDVATNRQHTSVTVWLFCSPHCPCNFHCHCHCHFHYVCYCHWHCLLNCHCLCHCNCACASSISALTRPWHLHLPFTWQILRLTAPFSD